MQFGVLGPFEVIGDDGEPLDLGGPRQRAVLAVLCINARRVVPLDRIVDDMWGDAPPQTASATLQGYISNLRRILEPGRQARTPASVLITRAPGYMLDVDPRAIDAEIFADLVDGARSIMETDPSEAVVILDRALGMWRGPALADFAYEGFAQSEIHRLEEMRTAATEEHFEAALRLGGHLGVVPEIEAHVRVHPLRERAWGQLMVALYRSGRQADALRAGRRLATALADIGLEPSDELRDIEERILAKDPSLRPPLNTEHATRTSRAEPTSDVLVGRAGEMALAESAMRAAVGGRGSVLVVEGEPGAGKSRLLDEIVSIGRTSGCTVVVARCFEVGATPPFWPWIVSSRSLMSQLGVDVVTEAAGGLATEFAPYFPELRRDGRRRPPTDVSPHTVAQAIATASRNLGVPVVICIDDAHVADADSLGVLGLLASLIDDLPLALIVTARAERSEIAAEVIGELLRLRATRRSVLRPLDAAEVAALAAQVTGGPVDSATAEAVHARTDGNPFFVLELTRLLASERELTADRAGHGDRIPGTVRDVVRLRLSRLPDETIAVLRVGAVFGRTFDLDLVAAAAGVDDEDALDAIDLALASGIVESTDRPTRFRFIHVLVRDTIVADVNPLRLARLHARVAEELERLGPLLPSRSAEAAHHAIEARSVIGVERALAAVRNAAHAMASAGGLAGAEALHRRRLDLIVELEDPGARAIEEYGALVDLSTVLVVRHGYQSDDLVPIHDRLTELVGGAGPELAVPATIGRWVFHTVRGELDDAERYHGVLTAMLHDGPDPMGRFVVDHSGGIGALHRGRVTEAIERFARCEELLGVLDPDDSATVLIPGLDQAALTGHTNFLSIAQWLSGDAAAARSTVQRGLAAAARAGHTYSMAFGATCAAYLAAMDGDVPRAIEMGRRAHRLCGENGYLFLTSMVDAAVGWAEGITGSLEAIERLQRVDDALTEGRVGGFSTVSWGLIADVLLRAGELERADDVLAKAVAFSDRSGEMIWRPELERLRAIVDAELGRPCQSADTAAELADRFGTRGASSPTRPGTGVTAFSGLRRARGRRRRRDRTPP